MQQNLKDFISNLISKIRTNYAHDTDNSESFSNNYSAVQHAEPLTFPTKEEATNIEQNILAEKNN